MCKVVCSVKVFIYLMENISLIKIVEDEMYGNLHKEYTFMNVVKVNIFLQNII